MTPGAHLRMKAVDEGGAIRERPRVGKSKLHVASLVGAAMCSAC